MSLDGHLAVVRTVIISYEFLPIGSIPDSSRIFTSGMEAAGLMWSAAAAIMLPYAVVLLLIQVSIGVITRSAPTLNLFSFAFPITMMAVFFIVFLSVTSLGTSFSKLISDAIFAMQQMIESITHG